MNCSDGQKGWRRISNLRKELQIGFLNAVQCRAYYFALFFYQYTYDSTSPSRVRVNLDQAMPLIAARLTNGAVATFTSFRSSDLSQSI